MPRGIAKNPQERARRLSEAHRGMKRPPFSEQWKRKQRISQTGQKRSIETREKMSESHKGKKPKNLGISFGIKGEKNPNWKGTTPLMKQVRNCFEYRQWRSDIFTRDDYTCQVCGVKGVYLEVDHYPKMFSTIFHEYKIKSLEEALNCAELWNMNNGRTVCKEHNPRVGRSKAK